MTYKFPAVNEAKMNEYSSEELPNFMTHKVEVLVRIDKCTLALRIPMGGNVKGGNIIQSVLSNVEDLDLHKNSIEVMQGIVLWDEEGYPDAVILTNPELYAKDPGHLRASIRMDDPLMMFDNVIGAAIVDWEEDV